MAKSAGRAFVVKTGGFAGTPIAAITSKNLDQSVTPIDTTTDDSNGIEEFLDDAMQRREMTITCDGYTDADILHDAATSIDPAAKFFADLCFVGHNGDYIVGNFILTNYVETGADGAGQFSATFTRNGTHTYTQV